MSALSPLDALRLAAMSGRYSGRDLDALIARLSPAEIHQAFDERLVTAEQAARALTREMSA